MSSERFAEEEKNISKKMWKTEIIVLTKKGKMEREGKREMCGSFPSFRAIIVKVNENDGKYENALLLHDFSIIFSFPPYMLIIDVWCV
jgi:hypothetical protein